MLIIVDKKIPEEAKQRLSLEFDDSGNRIVELETSELVYPEISGHPDIFICPTSQTLIVSRNLPRTFFQILDAHSVSYTPGHTAAGDPDSITDLYPQGGSRQKRKALENHAATAFNAAINDHFLVHRLEYTDPVILENCRTLKKVAVKQGYSRCNLLLLGAHHFITCDAGIYATLQRSGLDGIHVSAEGILLPGFPNGFIGGALGLTGSMVVINGSLRFHRNGERISEYLISRGYSLLELYDGPLFDGGGIFFI
jgi:hypothetical protein